MELNKLTNGILLLSARCIKKNFQSHLKVLLWCTYTEHLMHEISDLMQGFNFFFSSKASIFFSQARLQSSIFSPYSDSFWHKLSQYGKKILYTYVYHIVYYLGKCEALHEITDFVHEMLSVCAPIHNMYKQHVQMYIVQHMGS